MIEGKKLKDLYLLNKVNYTRHIKGVLTIHVVDTMICSENFFTHPRCLKLVASFHLFLRGLEIHVHFYGMPAYITHSTNYRYDMCLIGSDFFMDAWEVH